MTGTKDPAPESNLAEPLSRWLGWTDAIALSSALNATGPRKPPEPWRLSAAEDVERVKAHLISAIAEACASVGPTRRAPLEAGRPPQETAPVAAPEYATYRQRYQSMQHAMEERIEPLRERLRTRLAARSPQGARLAAVDELMERTLASRGQLLLHEISTQRLQRRFEHLKPDGGAAGPWLDTFRKDMQALLLAELDTRMQVVEGLLAALQSVPASQ